MILNVVAEKLKRRAKNDFKRRHFEAWLIIQAVSRHLRYPLSSRDLESLFDERGFDVDHATINRWVLADAPMIESDHFRVKRTMPKVGGFRSFATARRTIAGFEAMLWLRKGLGFAGEWSVRRQNELLQLCFGLQKVNEV